MKTKAGNDCGSFPQIKVCGLTEVDEAIQCAELGADAIGMVFYPPSPRNLSPKAAREIAVNLPRGVRKVGVFVDEPFVQIVNIAQLCGLDFVQLHGCESPEMVDALRLAGLSVIKALFAKKPPFLSQADHYRASAFLVEGGAGESLPGGTGLGWQWSEAAKPEALRPCILAGGLNPQNVGEAILQFGPDAVDVSSGVESAPGRKDGDKVRAFIEAVRNTKQRFAPGRVF
jgi:phosphoribosylanthranilate isomerase/indole-3-glycerol phosphate synthase/phosphoribosylanthranilate isomerase